MIHTVNNTNILNIEMRSIVIKYTMTPFLETFHTSLNISQLFRTYFKIHNENLVLDKNVIYIF